MNNNNTGFNHTVPGYTTGFNSPRSDHPAITITRKLPTRCHESYVDACRKQLALYKAYVSDNDAALHYKYRGCYNTIAMPPENSPAMRLYNHTSVFRELMYYEIPDYFDGMMRKAGRGEYMWTVKVARLFVVISPDEFNITFSLN